MEAQVIQLILQEVPHEEVYERFLGEYYCKQELKGLADALETPKTYHFRSALF